MDDSAFCFLPLLEIVLLPVFVLLGFTRMRHHERWRDEYTQKIDGL